jgi:hypothetical protein
MTGTDMIEERIEDKERAAPRMALSLPGEFIGVQSTQRCIITNFSRTGALIALAEPFKTGSRGYLRCGPIDHFMVVRRMGQGTNALEFIDPITDSFVFGIRKLQEQFAEHEQAELLDTVRRWATGSDTRHR